ncbi:MAG: TolC family protein, partial [Thermoanaerobaculia bacterium]|nr:TolC family protein [Thermoanaerobaculia bacterium]
RGAGRPELRLAAQRAAAEQALLDLARVEARPEPTVTGGYKEQSGGLDGVFLGAALRLPLFDRNRGEIASRTARLESEETRLALARRRVENDVRDAWAAYDAIGRTVGLLGEANLLAEAESLLESAVVSYTEGEMSLVELLDAAEAYRDSRIGVRGRTIDLWVAYFGLLRATGATAADPDGGAPGPATVQLPN